MSDERYGFLDNEAPDEPQDTAPPEPVTVEPTPETPATPAPTAAEPEATHVPLAALKAEREKRQQYERRVAEYEQRERAAQQQVPEPNFYEAPEQYVNQAVNQARQ